MIRYDPSLPPDEVSPIKLFDLSATLRRLSAVLTDDEVGAIAPLVKEKERQPEGLLRYDGALYVRYMGSFWCVTGGTMVPFHGIFPNAALNSGVEKLTIPVEEQ